ncbi:MAG: hypothetical protein C0504_16705 [Candidatus Solibacter sp.]|nr:hypothetical protein [Candidatus Solibacter sp.]
MRACMRRRSGAGERGMGLIPVLGLIVAVGVVWVMWEPALSGAGTFLDNGEAARKADAIVVVAGGWGGERIEAAARLKEQGYAPVVLVSGAVSLYGQKECGLALTYIQSKGYRTEGYACAESGANSTKEESAVVAENLRRRGLKSALIVSCDTHMRRAGRLWRKEAPELELTFISAPSPSFELKRWYRTREGRKAVFLEWTKLVTSYLGI